MLIRTVVLLCGLLLPLMAQAAIDAVAVSIIADNGRSLREYPVENRRDLYRAYVEAQPGMHYAIRVRNLTGERVGVVIAVDGRNIISGQRSRLRPNERMYILEPYGQYTYRGWRTGQNRVNRFYFTDAGGSYAAAWGDYSAMGVIALAVYHERRRPEARRPHGPQIQRTPEPGTGFGQTERSPSRQVAFNPEPHASGRWLVKYEWRDSLCQRGVINCRPVHTHQPGNRFWPDDDRGGYAPRPPRQFYRQ